MQWEIVSFQATTEFETSSKIGYEDLKKEITPVSYNHMANKNTPYE